MTKAELIAELSAYPDDTPIFDGRGYDLHASSIREQKYDIWGQNPTDADGYETPGVGVGISIGPRF